MKLSLGFSTCPNDTFIFDAMIHGKVDTEGLSFDVVMADVEELNRRAFRHDIQVTKLSYHAFAHVAANYTLLRAGSALGRRNGPLVIGLPPLPAELPSDAIVAIPGKFTTANLLFSIFFPGIAGKREVLFSEIESILLKKEADAGVIIHENRFTYARKGLAMMADLGEMWEAETGLPIPLGGIAADRSLPPEVRQRLNRVMKRSVSYALAHPASSATFVKEYAKEMEEEVIRQHIDLYVNNFTVDLGEEGSRAVTYLFREAFKKRNYRRGSGGFSSGSIKKSILEQ